MQIDTLKKYIVNGDIRWSTHCLERMQERDISRIDVKKCIEEGEIIEDYPDDFPYPSCLIFGYTINKKLYMLLLGVMKNIFILLQFIILIQLNLKKI